MNYKKYETVVNISWLNDEISTEVNVTNPALPQRGTEWRQTNKLNHIKTEQYPSSANEVAAWWIGDLIIPTHKSIWLGKSLDLMCPNLFAEQ